MSKIPKLRFKEFSGEWESKKLGELGEFKKTYSFSRSVEGEGNYKHIHYGDIHMNYKGIISKDKLIPSIDIPSDDSYELVKERDIIFADASEDRKDLGKVAVVRSIEGSVISGLHTMCFRPKETLNSEFFLNHSLNKEYLKFMYTKGNGAKVLGISKANLLEYKFLAPSKEEQEKIASFFSLIDDKISLQSKKVEALKDYKKGMMQKIFSRELRFKDDEGRDYPEWEVKRFRDFVKINQGLQIPISERYTSEGENRYFYITNEFLKAGSDTKYYIENPPQSVICEDDDILMTRTGNTGKVVTGVSGAFHNNFFKIDYDRDKYNKMFLYYVLTSHKIQKNIVRLAGTSTIPDLNHGDFYNIKIKLPMKIEQDKIAILFINIDNKIKKEQEKLNYLTEYKKGLLQQIFI